MKTRFLFIMLTVLVLVGMLVINLIGCTSGNDGGTEGNGTVSGTVADATTGKVIQNVTVYMGAVAAKSDLQGEYTLQGVNSGEQTIRAIAGDYVDYEASVTVSNGGVTTHNISMTPGENPSPTPTWFVDETSTPTEMKICYGTPGNYPQYGALHKYSGYFRLISTTDSGWGTSVVTTPSFWEDGDTPVYHQGADINTSWQGQGEDLLINFDGQISTLSFTGTILINPPAENSITATVSVTTSGDVDLADRPDEAFKPVMLSSMHESDDIWDASKAFVGTTQYDFPTSGWIVQPAVTNAFFGVIGGTSSWKTNAPTIEITMDQALPVTGWVTESTDPNDDNVAFWTANTVVMRSWKYTIVSKRP